jgi:hypothetical protein
MMFFALVLSSCNEESIGRQPQDNVPPGPVSEVTYIAIPGGAVFRYYLPDDEDLLCVKALYSRNGIAVETKASIYADSLMIEGFGNTQPLEVKLIAVDRSQNESTPVLQTITPLEPDVFHIGKSLDLVPDFGGVHAYWDNVNRKEISVVISVKDHNDEYIPVETFYSAKADGDRSIYGMDTIPYDFGVYAQDRWGNKTETKLFTLTPLFETRFDRTLFRDAKLPNDVGPVNTSWVMPNLWDGLVGNQGFGSPAASVWPQSITIDLGVNGRISRLRVFQRGGSYIFREGNLRNFEVWGCVAPLDMSGNWNSWTLLGIFESIKPSGLPFGENSSEDIDRGTNGEDFFFSPINPSVQYIRIRVTKTWAGGDNFQTSELEFYGDNR